MNIALFFLLALFVSLRLVASQEEEQPALSAMKHGREE